MYYRTFGGLAFIAIALQQTGWLGLSVSATVVGILALIAGIALLAGK
jgi:hypothetical protein